MAGVQWLFNLIDRTSAPAKTVATALDKVTQSSEKATEKFAAAEKAMTKGRDSLGRFTKGAGSATQGINGLSAGTMKLGSFDSAIGNIGGGIASIAKYAAAAGVALGGMFTLFSVGLFKAQAFKETTMTSLKLILKDGKAAADVWADSVYLAAKTPLDTQQVINSMRKLLALGMNKDEARFSFQALGDVASLSESPGQALDMMTLALGQIKAAGKLNMQDLKQITNWSAAAGVGLSQVYETIAQQMGKTTADIPKMMEQGLISGEAGVFAILKTFQDKVSGGAAGSVMLAQGATLNGLFSSLSSKPFEFFAAIDDSQGIKNIKSALANIVEVFDPSTKAGQKLVALIADLTDEMFSFLNAFAGGGGQDAFADWLTSAVDGVRAFIVEVKTGFVAGMDIFRQMTGESSDGATDFVTVMREVGMVVGVVVTALGFLAGMLRQAYDGWDILLNKFDWGYIPTQMWEAVKGLGSSIIDGIVEGITGAASRALGAITGVANDVVAAAAGIFQIHSPSKVFEDIGRNTIAGFNVGVENEPVSPMVSTTGPGGTAMTAPVGRSAGGSRGPMTVNVSLNVDARGADGASLAKKLAELLPGELMAAFEAMAIEGGVG